MSTEPGFTISSPCGRVWFLPLQAVKDDYASFLMQVDHLSTEEAHQKVEENIEFIETWFSEQFDWSDVERLGLLIKVAKESDIKRALDFYRDNSNTSPASCSISATLK